MSYIPHIFTIYGAYCHSHVYIRQYDVLLRQYDVLIRHPKLYKKEQRLDKNHLDIRGLGLNFLRVQFPSCKIFLKQERAAMNEKTPESYECKGQRHLQKQREQRLTCEKLSNARYEATRTEASTRP